MYLSSLSCSPCQILAGLDSILLTCHDWAQFWLFVQVQTQFGWFWHVHTLSKHIESWLCFVLYLFIWCPTFPFLHILTHLNPFAHMLTHFGHFLRCSDIFPHFYTCSPLFMHTCTTLPLGSRRNSSISSVLWGDLSLTLSKAEGQSQ